jgi:hypothetical protein
LVVLDGCSFCASHDNRCIRSKLEAKLREQAGYHLNNCLDFAADVSRVHNNRPADHIHIGTRANYNCPFTGHRNGPTDHGGDRPWKYSP